MMAQDRTRPGAMCGVALVLLIAMVATGVAYTWLGGSRILDRVERDRGSLMQHRPALAAGDAPLLLLRALTWNPRPPRPRRH